MRFGWSAKDTSARLRGIAKAGAVLWVVMYVAVYIKLPFPELWNNIISNLLLVIPAALAATIATLVWTHYDQTDIPRRIWRYFAIGLWLWVIAEAVWGYLNVTQGEVTEGPADIFWVAAYILFAYALFIQYQLLAQPDRQETLRRASLAVLVLVVLYVIVYRLLAAGADEQSRFGTAVNSFYPVADLFLAVVASWLIHHFRGGAFARPWLGLLAFSFTDLLYAWIEASGVYSWTVDHANLWTTLFDTAYVAAYLILGLGILSQWAFLKYGLRSPQAKQAN